MMEKSFGGAIFLYLEFIYLAATYLRRAARHIPSRGRTAAHRQTQHALEGCAPTPRNRLLRKLLCGGVSFEAI